MRGQSENRFPNTRKTPNSSLWETAKSKRSYRDNADFLGNTGFGKSSYSNSSRSTPSRSSRSTPSRSGGVGGGRRSRR